MQKLHQSQLFFVPLQELLVVQNPYADAVALPSRSAINAAKAANRQYKRTVSNTSSAETSDSTDSASYIQSYIQQHYNVRTAPATTLCCMS